MTKNVLIAVLRNDLRLHDHPVLHLCADSTPSAAKFQNTVTHVLPVYVWDQRHVEVSGFQGMQKADKQGGGKGESQFARTRTLGLWRTGIHRAKFINKSVFDLRDRLRGVGSDLAMFAGTPESVIPLLVNSIREAGDTVEGVYMGKEINTEEVNVEKRLSSRLRDLQCPLKLLHGKSMIHPHDLGFPIKELPDVFTHFRKQVEGSDMFRPPEPAPQKLKPFPIDAVKKLHDAPGSYNFISKESLGSPDEVERHLLAPLLKDPVLGHKELLSKVMSSSGTDLNVPHSAFPYSGGESEALKRLNHYFDGEKSSPGASYKETRNGMLGADYSTKFAAALAHGLLSPRLIAQKAVELDQATGATKGGGYWILFELLWRDYFIFVGQKFGSHMFTLGGIEEVINPGSAGSKAYDWKNTASLEEKKDPFVRWAVGKTGVPMIDANMTELVQTGFMSNRGRQNVASFLTKDLVWNWQYGAEYFESWLIDYDPNSNWGNWQYVAGVGNDPRSSRQFNPIKQGKDYDLKGEFIKTWIPQLENVAEQYRHHPWTAPSPIDLGDYPNRPMMEQQMWKKHYANHGGGGGGRGGGRGGHRGGGGRGGGRGGEGGGGHRGGKGRGRGGKSNGGPPVH